MEKSEKNPSKDIEFRNQNEEAKFKNSIRGIVKILRAGHFDYNETKYIIKEARQSLALKAPKNKKGIREHLSKEEAERIINCAYEKKGKYGLLVKTLLFTGTRVDEFVNIKVSNVYISDNKIFLEKPKGDKPRYVPIVSFIKHELITHIGERKVGYLFETNRNDKFSCRRIQQIIKEIALKVGIEKRVYPHMLRRTIATWLRDRKVPIEDIQLFLGHEKIDTTLLYAKGSIDNLTKDMGQALIEP